MGEKFLAKLVLQALVQIKQPFLRAMRLRSLGAQALFESGKVALLPFEVAILGQGQTLTAGLYLQALLVQAFGRVKQAGTQPLPEPADPKPVCPL